MKIDDGVSGAPEVVEVVEDLNRGHFMAEGAVINDLGEGGNFGHPGWGGGGPVMQNAIMSQEHGEVGVFGVQRVTCWGGEGGH